MYSCAFCWMGKTLLAGDLLLHEHPRWFRSMVVVSSENGADKMVHTRAKYSSML